MRRQAANGIRASLWWALPFAVVLGGFYLGVGLKLMASAAVALLGTLILLRLPSPHVAGVALLFVPVSLAGLRGVVTPGWLPVSPELVVIALCMAVLIGKAVLESSRTSLVDVPITWIWIRRLAWAQVALLLVLTLGNEGSLMLLLPWILGAVGLTVGTPALRAHVDLPIRYLLVGLGLVAATESLAYRFGIMLIPGAGALTIVDPGPGADPYRIAGALGDYELLAEMMMLCVVLGMWAVLREAAAVWRVLGAVCVALGGYVLVLTGTRSASILTAVGLGGVLLLQPRRRAVRSLVVGLFITGLVWQASGASDSLLLERLGSTQVGGNPIDSIGRLQIWEYVLNSQAFVGSLGIGTGLPFPYLEVTTWPHSAPLSAYLLAGWAGAVLLIATAIVTWAGLWRGARSPVADRTRELAAVWLIVYTLFCVDQLKIEFIRTSTTVLLYFALMQIAGVFIEGRAAAKRSPRRKEMLVA